MVDDVQAAGDFYTGHLGFTLRFNAGRSSAGRPMPDGRKPQPGGWNRIHFIVPDIAAEVARLRAEGVRFRNEIITGPGGKQILIEDPAGNAVELFEPAAAPGTAPDRGARRGFIPRRECAARRASQNEICY